MTIIYVLLGWVLISLIGTYSDDSYSNELLDKKFKIKHIVFLPLTLITFIVLILYCTFKKIADSRFIFKIQSLLNKDI